MMMMFSLRLDCEGIQNAVDQASITVYKEMSEFEHIHIIYTVAIIDLNFVAQFTSEALNLKFLARARLTGFLKLKSA